jgi:hypothetical protein
MPNHDVLGWLAAALMAATFSSREARAMRPLALATNLAFIGYGASASLMPVLTLHLVLLPINAWRWAEALRQERSAGAGATDRLPPLPWPRPRSGRPMAADRVQSAGACRLPAPPAGCRSAHDGTPACGRCR